MKKYVFRKYDSNYKDYFKLEKEKLVRILDSNVKIEHIGSTAISNLGGKGIVDIMIGVLSSDQLNSMKNKLEEAGYEFREKASYSHRLFFRKDYFDEKRRVHLHLVEFNSDNWKEVIHFRDYLLKHPKLIKEYETVKKEAVKISNGDGDIYKKHKEKFIERIKNKNN